MKLWFLNNNEIDYVTYDLFKRFSNIFGDSLCFETHIKNSIIRREEYAGNVNIVLCFQKDYILVPLSVEKSPYAPLLAVFFNQYVSGKNHNLSFLYQDTELWNTIKLATYNKELN